MNATYYVRVELDFLFHFNRFLELASAGGQVRLALNLSLYIWSRPR